MALRRLASVSAGSGCARTRPAGRRPSVRIAPLRRSRPAWRGSVPGGRGAYRPRSPPSAPAGSSGSARTPRTGARAPPLGPAASALQLPRCCIRALGDGLVMRVEYTPLPRRGRDPHGGHARLVVGLNQQRQPTGLPCTDSEQPRRTEPPGTVLPHGTGRKRLRHESREAPPPAGERTFDRLKRPLDLR